MDGKRASVGSLLLAGSGAILTSSGTAGGGLLLSAGVVALVATVVGSLRESVDLLAV